jgi:hypothetical protein
MVSKNVVPQSRSLALEIAEGVGRLIQGILAGGEPERQALDECRAAAAGMRKVMEVRLAEVEETRRNGGKSRTGEVFKGDTNGNYTWGTHLKLFLNVIGTTLATGVLMGFPLYQQDLKEAGVFNYGCGVEHTCKAQDEPLGKLYQYSLYTTMVLFMVLGMWFDFLGAQVSALIGSFLSCFSCLGIGLAISLDSKSVPVTQTVLMYTSFILADSGGFIASMCMYAWLWHYPRAQTFIIGLCQGTQQLSSLLGVCVHALVEIGFSCSTSFKIMSLSGLAAAFVLCPTVPTPKEFYEEAGRVLNMRPASLYPPSPSWWSIKLQFKILWGALRVFPLHSFLVFSAQACGYVGTMLWLTTWGVTYRQWFDEEGLAFLTGVYESVPVIGGILLNPLTGVLMDGIGLPNFTLALIVASAGMTSTVLMQSISGQTAFMCFWALYIGTMTNVLGRWPLYFMPPSVFGIALGSFTAFAAVVGILYNLVSWQLHIEGELPIFAWLMGSCLCFSVVSFLLLKKGLPKRPPKSKYDSEAHLLES